MAPEDAVTPSVQSRPLARSRVLMAATVASVTIVSSLIAGAQETPARPPAPSLSRPVTATMPPDAAGFLRRWLVLEPIRASGQLTDTAVRTAIATEYFPNQLSVIPRDGETVNVNGAALAWHALDTRAYNVNLYHFAWALGKPTTNVLFWVVTIVDAPRELSGVRLAIGSNAASIWWVNDQEVIGIYNDRQTVIDDGVSRRLTLKKGANVIRAAIFNAGGATDFCARFLDSEEKPLTGFSVRADSGNSR